MEISFFSSKFLYIVCGGDMPCLFLCDRINIKTKKLDLQHIQESGQVLQTALCCYQELWFAVTLQGTLKGAHCSSKLSISLSGDVKRN